MVSFSIGMREGNVSPDRATAGRLVIASNDPAFEARVRGAFAAEGEVELHWWRDPDPGAHVSQSIAEIAAGGTAAVALGPDHARGVVLELARALNAVHPQVGVVIVRKPSRRLLHAALLVGARDVINPDANESDLRDGLGRVLDMVDRQRAAFDTAAAELASADVAQESEIEDTTETEAEDGEGVRPGLELVSDEPGDHLAERASDDWGFASWAALPSDVEDLESPAYDSEDVDEGDDFHPGTDLEDLETGETLAEAAALPETAEAAAATDDPVASGFASWAALPAGAGSYSFEGAASFDDPAVPEPAAEDGQAGVEPLADESFVVEPVGVGFGSWVDSESTSPPSETAELEDDLKGVEDAATRSGDLPAEGEDEAWSYEPVAVSWVAQTPSPDEPGYEAIVEDQSDDSPESVELEAIDQEVIVAEWIDPDAQVGETEHQLEPRFASAWVTEHAELDEWLSASEASEEIEVEELAPAAEVGAWAFTPSWDESSTALEEVAHSEASTWEEPVALEAPAALDEDPDEELDPTVSFESATPFADYHAMFASSHTETESSQDEQPAADAPEETAFTTYDPEPVDYTASATPFADYQAMFASSLTETEPSQDEQFVADPAVEVTFATDESVDDWPVAPFEHATQGLVGEATPEPSWADLGGLRDESMESPGYVVTVLSPKGGVGRTTVATNLAIGLAEVAPGQVVIVDLDLQFGDVADALRLLPERTFDDTRYSGAAHDPLALKAELTPHPLNLFALCAPATLRSADELKPEHVQRVLELLAKSFRYVVVDTPAGLNEHTIRAIELSTDLVLLSATDVPSVRATRREIEALRGMSDPTQRCHFVLNRADARTGLHAAAIEQVVGMHIDVAIPSSGAVPLALNQGTPILEADPRSPVSLAMSELVARFGAGDTASSKGTGPFWRKKQARR